MDKDYARCPGCGLLLPGENLEPDSQYNASGECRKLFDELAFYTLSLHDSFFIHQLIVDAYQASHARYASKPIGTAFALIGLYLVCERNLSGKQAQREHMRLARTHMKWPEFNPPVVKATRTVVDVIKEKPGIERDAMIKKWAKSVWNIWSYEHENVAALVGY
jgi:hypothetical protein